MKHNFSFYPLSSVFNHLSVFYGSFTNTSKQVIILRNPLLCYTVPRTFLVEVILNFSKYSLGKIIKNGPYHLNHNSRTMRIFNFYGLCWIGYRYIDYFLICIKDLVGFLGTQGLDINLSKYGFLGTQGQVQL